MNAAADAATESGRQYNPDIYMRTRFYQSLFSMDVACPQWRRLNTLFTPHGFSIFIICTIMSAVGTIKSRNGKLSVIDFNDFCAFFGHPIAHSEMEFCALCAFENIKRTKKGRRMNQPPG